MQPPVERPTPVGRPTQTPISNLRNLGQQAELLTRTRPDGVVEIIPSIRDTLDENERLLADAYVTAFRQHQAEAAGAARPRGEPPAPPEQLRQHRFLGHLDDSGGTEVVITPDGRSIPVPPGAAYQPSTNRVYVANPLITENEARRGLSVPANVAVSVGGSFLMDPAQLIDRALERAQHGLVIPEEQLVREAISAAGLASTGSFGVARAKEGAEALAGAISGATEARVGTAGAGRGRPPARDVVSVLSDDAAVRRALIAQGIEEDSVTSLLQGFRLQGFVEELSQWRAVEESPPILRSLSHIEGTYPKIKRAIEQLTGMPIDDVIKIIESRSSSSGTILGTAGASRGPRRGTGEPPPLVRETDPAGFHTHALEVAKTRLPASATPERMRAALLRNGVDEFEIGALRLDDLLLGQAGAAKRVRDDIYNSVSNLARASGEALQKFRQHPDNPMYRERYNTLRQQLDEGRSILRAADRSLEAASRNEQSLARDTITEAEARIKQINQALREKISYREPTEQALTPARRAELYAERTAARRQIAEAGAILSGGPRKSNRRVTAQQLASWIRANRPQMERFVRQLPSDEALYGPNTWRGIQAVRANEGQVIAQELFRRGVDDQLARRVGKSIAESRPGGLGIQVV
jgi:hypothetical protein